MMLIPAGGRLGGVTLLQVRPLSRGTGISPGLGPIPMTPAVTGDGAIVVIEPPGAGAPTPPPPAGAAAIATPGGAARSGLIACHVSPRSVDASTRCAAM